MERAFHSLSQNHWTNAFRAPQTSASRNSSPALGADVGFLDVKIEVYTCFKDGTGAMGEFLESIIRSRVPDAFLEDRFSELLRINLISSSGFSQWTIIPPSSGLLLLVASRANLSLQFFQSRSPIS